MASVSITFCTAGNRSAEGGSMPVPRMVGAISEVLTLSGTSTATSNASPAVEKTGFVSVTAIDGDAWITAGATPVAVAGAAGFAVLTGQTRDFAVEAGARIAVIAL